MSIPPLACDSPPPTNLCEDENYCNNFDLEYDVPQEDENENYDFQCFPNFNSSKSSPPQLLVSETHSNIKNLNSNEADESTLHKSVHPSININTNNSQLDYSIPLESLDFKCEVLENRNPEAVDEQYENNFDNTCNVFENDMKDIQPASLSIEKHNSKIETAIESDNLTDERDLKLANTENINVIQEENKNSNEHSNQDSSVNDFDDGFVDFVVVPTESTQVSTGIDICNPWEDNEVHNFAKFEATFEQSDIDDTNLKSSTSILQTEASPSQPNDPIEDDDFGDFDDFKSSASNNKIETTLDPQINESDNIISNISEIISEVFSDEIPECETLVTDSLESMLSETWRLLLEADIRQPYMVYWNTTLGQKMLLKAMGIDSRNTLFEPKWNMNKNISMIPLEPIKQPFPIVRKQPDESTSPKWSEIETSNKQDILIAKEDFREITELSKNSQVLSDTLVPASTANNIPNIINLPDTHIFTPTNSETPKSQRIINNSSPTIFPRLTDNDNPVNEKNYSKITNVQNCNDDEYSDFQDFNCAAPIPNNKLMMPPNNPTAGNSVNIWNSIDSSILEPIKVSSSSTIPQLDWPDPGDVTSTLEHLKAPSWDKQNAQIGKNEDDIFGLIDHSPQKCDNTSSVVNSDSFQSVERRDTSNVNIFETNYHHSTHTSLGTKIADDNATSKTLTNSKSLGFSHQNTSTDTILQQNTPNKRKPFQNHQTSEQILQPLSLESYSQINWPSSNLSLQDLSNFNPMETFESLKCDSSSVAPKVRLPTKDDDIWGEFVSTKSVSKKPYVPPEDEEWTDFISSTSSKSHNGLNTISFNVQTNSNKKKINNHNTTIHNEIDMPTLNYISPGANNFRPVNDKHVQNL